MYCYERWVLACVSRQDLRLWPGRAGEWEEVNTKNPIFYEDGISVMLLWRLPTLPGLTQVSSAVPGLTSLFGMGRGEHRANSHQQAL